MGLYETYIYILGVQKRAFFCKIQSLFKNKRKNINQRNIFRLHQRAFAIFRGACEFLDDRNSPALKR